MILLKIAGNLTLSRQQLYFLTQMTDVYLSNIEQLM